MVVRKTETHAQAEWRGRGRLAGHTLMEDETRIRILRAAAEDAGAVVVALEMGQRLAIRLEDGSPRGIRIPIGSEVVDSIRCHSEGTPARARAEKALARYLKKTLEEAASSPDSDREPSGRSG